MQIDLISSIGCYKSAIQKSINQFCFSRLNVKIELREISQERENVNVIPRVHFRSTVSLLCLFCVFFVSLADTFVSIATRTGIFQAAAAAAVTLAAVAPPSSHRRERP